MREDGRLHATPLLLTVVAVIVADIAFAVDSIPAALAVTRDAGVIWTANAFALLGLGALLALVDILARRFRYLDKTIAVDARLRRAEDPARRRRARRRPGLAGRSSSASWAPASSSPWSPTASTRRRPRRRPPAGRRAAPSA